MCIGILDDYLRVHHPSFPQENKPSEKIPETGRYHAGRFRENNIQVF
jgi:hypothetical protein